MDTVESGLGKMELFCFDTTSLNTAVAYVSFQKTLILTSKTALAVTVNYCMFYHHSMITFLLGIFIEVFQYGRLSK